MPGLPCSTHGCAATALDDVVAVELLERFEEVERAAGATGAADVDADGRVAEQLRDLRARLRRAGMRRVVARVLDDGRVRTLVGRTGQRHLGAELGAVARRDVLEPVDEMLRRRRATATGYRCGAMTCSGADTWSPSTTV